MAENFISRGFKGKARNMSNIERLPPGQYETKDFPVLSAGPTPHVNLDAWDFTIYGDAGRERKWTWKNLQDLPSEKFKTDIHCVTKWSKFDTVWEGIPVADLLAEIEPHGNFLIAFCDGGYSTNLPVADVASGKAWLVFSYDNQPLAPEHGGPVRLLVPHLYFWKSAKWIRGFKIVSEDRPGFWESNGYHIYGDPWREQRYAGD